MSKPARKLSLPAIALVVAFLATAVLLLVTTMRSLDRDRKWMERELERQSTAIIRTLESGVRTGMMMRWGREQLQALMVEANRLPEIAYVGIFDSGGGVIAEDGPGISTPPRPPASRIGEFLRQTPPSLRRLVWTEAAFSRRPGDSLPCTGSGDPGEEDT